MYRLSSLVLALVMSPVILAGILVKQIVMGFDLGLIIGEELEAKLAEKAREEHETWMKGRGKNHE